MIGIPWGFETTPGLSDRDHSREEPETCETGRVKMMVRDVALD